MTERVPALVVGGGIAGLAAAHGFVTLAGGLGELVAALESRLAGRVRTGRRAVTVKPDARGFAVALDDGSQIEAGTIVLAVPAFAAGDLLEGTDPALGTALRSLPVVSTATVSVGFPRGVLGRPLARYGYVSPRAEGGSVVACTYTSNKFPARAQGGVLLRFFIGRAGDDRIVAEEDDALKAVVRAELRAVQGITAEPALWRIYRWPHGMPQYTLGHRDRLMRVEGRVAQMPGLVLAGASYRGVGLPDCIASGWAAADSLVTRLREAGG